MLEKIFRKAKKALCLTALPLFLTSTGAQAENPDIYLEPPFLDYQAICIPQVEYSETELDRDWTVWNEDSLDVSAKEAISLSRIYLTGRGLPQRSPETALKILRIAFEQYPDQRISFLLPLARTLQDTASSHDELKEAESYLLEAYNSGYARAALALGEFYGDEGPAEMRNPALARQFMQLSALSGDTKGLVELAHFVLRDQASTEAQKRTAVTNALLGLIDEVKDGNCGALNTIGFLYLRGELVQKNISTALRWLEAYAETGDSKTANNLANLYRSNQVEQIDIEKSFTYLKQAADGGIAAAQFGLAKAYATGVSLERDTELAEKYLLMAEASGLPLADEWLARLYAGEFGGEPKPDLAKQYFERAMQAPERTKSLPLFYSDYLLESGAEKDLSTALTILKNAADNGSSDASNQVAKIYLALGKTNSQYFKDALEYFQISANSGDSDSASKIAKIYACGRGVPMAIGKANDWHHTAALLGNVNSLFVHGLSLLMSSDPADIERGRTYIKQAAFKGNAKAVGFALARWEKGVEGFEKSPATAERLEQFVAGIKDPEQRLETQLSVIRNRFELAETVEEKADQIARIDPLLVGNNIDAFLARAELLNHAGLAQETELRDLYTKVAEIGDRRGQRELGKLLLADLSLDATTGRAWLEKAAAAGDFKAKLALLDPGASDALGVMGDIAASGEFCTVDEMVSVARVYSTLPDPEAKTLARYWMSLAMASANRDADDLYVIGSAILDGVDGIEQRFRAEEFLMSALLLGRNSVLRDLAEGHLKGFWQESSPEKAKQFLQKLTDLGDKEAGNKLLSEIADGVIRSDQKEVSDLLVFLGDEVNAPDKYLLKLARLNLEGKLGETDPQKVLEWLTVSASNGEPNSMYRLYQAHFFGDGTTKDVGLGLDWLQKSAEAGNAKAARDLAVAYKVGVPGLSPDAEKASFWEQQFNDLSDVD